jgi:hypothetical protein
MEEQITLTDGDIKTVIQEIEDTAEVSRRALAKRRHDIYKDGGKRFLIEQIRREFSEDALKEMRLAPINLLKKIVNKRSSVYKRAPKRTSTDARDQALVDYYVKDLELDQVMQKVNRYYTLFSNTVLYTRPHGDRLVCNVIPPYLYSKLSDEYDKTKETGYVFNAFSEDDRMAATDQVPSATGYSSETLERGYKASTPDLVDSNERDLTNDPRRFMFWTAYEQFTTNAEGSKLVLDIEKGPEQWTNPIGCLPIVNVAKDRDNEQWATQGEDLIDLTLAIQLGWSDVLTVAKNQGFSILTIVSEEEPKKLTIGVNKAVWLKQMPNSPTPSISYVQAQSPLSEYKELLMDLLGLLLTTNDMEAQSIGGKGTAQNFTSGFHALISMSDNLEAVESDKPTMRNAEIAHFNVIAKWHNWMFDIGVLNDKAKALGKFSDKFEMTIAFAEVKPLESEDEVLGRVEKKVKLGVYTKKDTIKALNPDMTDQQVDEKLAELDAEVIANTPQPLLTKTESVETKPQDDKSLN